MTHVQSSVPSVRPDAQALTSLEPLDHFIRRSPIELVRLGFTGCVQIGRQTSVVCAAFRWSTCVARVHSVPSPAIAFAPLVLRVGTPSLVVPSHDHVDPKKRREHLLSESARLYAQLAPVPNLPSLRHDRAERCIILSKMKNNVHKLYR